MCVHRIGPFQLVTESVFDGRFLCIEEFTEQQVVETGRVLQCLQSEESPVVTTAVHRLELRSPHGVAIAQYSRNGVAALFRTAAECQHA